MYPGGIGGTGNRQGAGTRRNRRVLAGQIGSNRFSRDFRERVQGTQVRNREDRLMFHTLLVEDDVCYRQTFPEEDMQLVQGSAMSGWHDRVTNQY